MVLDPLCVCLRACAGAIDLSVCVCVPARAPWCCLCVSCCAQSVCTCVGSCELLRCRRGRTSLYMTVECMRAEYMYMVTLHDTSEIVHCVLHVSMDMHTYVRTYIHTYIRTRAGAIAACVHKLAKVRIEAGDFVVGEGLLRCDSRGVYTPFQEAYKHIVYVCVFSCSLRR